MRRCYPAAVREHYVIATPDIVQFVDGRGAQLHHEHPRRAAQFNMEDVANGGVPRLGAAVPRWYGETIGFWDDDVLITWTSNIQGWKSHSQFEFSSQMQSIEIYTPIRDKSGDVRRPQPRERSSTTRRRWSSRCASCATCTRSTISPTRTKRPYAFIECVQTIFSVDGINAPLTPGTMIEYEMPDMYGRPWDAIWQKYFEQGMSRKDTSEDIFKFD